MTGKIKLLPAGLMTAFCLKSLILGVNWESVAVIAALSSLYVFLEYKSMSDEAVKITKQLEDIEKQIKDQQLITSDLKNSVSSLRTATGLKQQTRGF